MYFSFSFFSGEKPQDRNQLNNSTLKKKKKKKKKSLPVISQKTITNFQLFFFRGEKGNLMAREMKSRSVHLFSTSFTSRRRSTVPR
jgi:hypothetical protein